MTGERRRLTRTEMEGLRANGPAGPKVLADALGELARARKDNDRHRLRKTLGEVASAAISWRERL